MDGGEIRIFSRNGWGGNKNIFKEWKRENKIIFKEWMGENKFIFNKNLVKL